MSPSTFWANQSQTGTGYKFRKMLNPKHRLKIKYRDLGAQRNVLEHQPQ
jgi:hypothetical protein